MRTVIFSLEKVSNMEASAGVSHIINVRITHQKSGISLIETAATKDLKNTLIDLCKSENIDECVILQTCNRTEVYVVSKDKEKASREIKEYLLNRCKTQSEEAQNAIEICSNQDALKHLLRVTSGLESMVIGEDQILGQVWSAYRTAKSAKTVGSVLKTVFTRAVNVGRRVRKETKINQGAVSIGSVAVELAETVLGTLKDKTVLVLGAGETGKLVTKTLAKCSPQTVLISNRTYERAEKLAKELQGKVVEIEKLDDAIKDADVIICSTSANEYLLKNERIQKIMKKRPENKELMIIDISSPRNVEEAVQQIQNVTLYNIDDLREIAEKNKIRRQEKTQKASKIIDDELFLLEQDLKAQTVNDVVSFLFAHAEEIRQKELNKAQTMLGDLDPKKREIIDNLTFEIVEQTLVPIVAKLRNAAVNGDQQIVDVATELFNNKNKTCKKLEKTALILVGHGSKLPHNRITLQKLAELLRSQSRFENVEIAFMMRNAPTISETIEKTVKSGAKKIVIIPAFIAHGIHTTDEIPKTIKTKKDELDLLAKGIEIIYGEPLGADERIVKIIEEKALALLGEEKNSIKESRKKKSLGKLVGVGVGPGDPELITVKALKLLKTADVISIPKAHKDKDSVALSVVKDVLEQRENPPEILELVFPMTTNKNELKDAWSKNAQIVAQKVKTGKTMVYITLGDPMVYSTFIYLCQRMQEEHPEVELEIVPGVTSVTACAGASMIPLAENDEVVAIIPSNVDSNRLKEIAQRANNLVLLKATKGLKELVPILEQSGFSENSTVTMVRRCTMPQQNIIVGNLKDAKNWDIPEDYFSISIIKDNPQK